MTTPPAHTPPKWHHVALTELTPGRFVVRFAISHVAIDSAIAKLVKLPDYVISGQTRAEATASAQAVESWMEKNTGSKSGL